MKLIEPATSELYSIIFNRNKAPQEEQAVMSVCVCVCYVCYVNHFRMWIILRRITLRIYIIVHARLHFTRNEYKFPHSVHWYKINCRNVERVVLAIDVRVSNFKLHFKLIYEDLLAYGLEIRIAHLGLHIYPPIFNYSNYIANLCNCSNRFL